MKLSCIINGKKYTSITQGCTFSDEYSEALDSGTIILNHIGKIEVKPYDMIYIFNEDKSFEKWMLIDSYEYEEINIDENLYNYTFSLFSETKLLETIPCPNLQITSGKERSLYWYLRNYVDMFSPKIRVKKGNSWEYTNKYVIDETCGFYTRNNDTSTFTTFKSYFEKRICPEISFNNPNLREVLTRLCQVVDCLPIVRKNKIQFINIGLANGTFNYNRDYCNVMISSFSSEGYIDRLIVDMQQGLDLDDESLLTRNVEYLGFRNSNSAYISIEQGNSEIRTNNPIYKINSFKICYPRIISYTVQYEDETTEEINAKTMCEWDISNLVLLNEKRNILSQDMISYGYIKNTDTSGNTIGYSAKSGTTVLNSSSTLKEILEQAKNFKYTTLGYSIGSNTIDGLLDTYTKLTGFWFWQQNRTYTVIEALLDTLLRKRPIGTNLDYDKIINELQRYTDKTIVSINKAEAVDNYEITTGESSWFNTLKSVFNNITTYDLATFKIDYYSLKSPVVKFTKKGRNGFITTTDNPATSITNISSLGILEYNKTDRLGNPSIRIPARYTDYKDINNVGSVYQLNDENIIFYHREIAIYENEIIVNYAGSQDYIMQNYYTSINSKIRAWNVASVSSSVQRKENKIQYIYFDTEKIEDKYTFDFSSNIYEDILSPLNVEKQGEEKKSLDTAYIICDGNASKLEAEITVAKNSLSFDFNLNDNVINNVGITNGIGSLDIITFFSSNKALLKDGLYQDYVKYAPNGWANSFEIGIYHCEDKYKEVPYIDASYTNTDLTNDELNKIYNKMFRLPYLDTSSDEFTRKDSYISYKYTNFNKDNKEIPCITLELEAISGNSNIRIGEAYWKCSNLVDADRTFKSYNDKLIGYADLTHLEISTENIYSSIFNNDIEMSLTITPASRIADGDYYRTSSNFTLNIPINNFDFSLMSIISYSDLIKTTFSSEYLFKQYDLGTIFTDVVGKITNITFGKFLVDSSYEKMIEIEIDDKYVLEGTTGKKRALLGLFDTGNEYITYGTTSEVVGAKRPVWEDKSSARLSPVGFTEEDIIITISANNNYIFKIENEAKLVIQNITRDNYSFNFTVRDEDTNIIYYFGKIESSKLNINTDTNTGTAYIKLSSNSDSSKIIELIFVYDDENEYILGICNFSKNITFLTSIDMQFDYHPQDMFLSFSTKTYNKYEINENGAIGIIQEDKTIDYCISVSSREIKIDRGKIDKTINFIGVYHKVKSKYQLVFGVNRGIEKVYVSIRENLDNYIYESQEKQNIVGEIGDNYTIINQTIYNALEKYFD